MSLKSDLDMFAGGTQHYYPYFCDVLLTDGVKYKTLYANLSWYEPEA